LIRPLTCTRLTARVITRALRLRLGCFSWLRRTRLLPLLWPLLRAASGRRAPPFLAVRLARWV
jgi:hypothetical protein